MLSLLWCKFDPWTRNLCMFQAKPNNDKENFTLVNIHVPNIGTPKYIQQILTDIKGKTEEFPWWCSRKESD